MANNPVFSVDKAIADKKVELAELEAFKVDLKAAV